MTRDEAYAYLRLHKQMEAEGIKIVDHDKNKVEVQFPEGFRQWLDDIQAAILIEARTA